MGCDRMLVLGDIVGYGADPDAVIDRLAAREAITIAGNHDLAATGAFDVSWFNDAAAAAIAWTKNSMSPDSKEFLSSLDPIRETEHGLLVHGSVRDPVAEYLLSAEEAAASFELAPCERYMLNPGSVGQPRDRDPRAAFIVFDGEKAVGHRVGYPIDRAAKKIRAA